MSNKTYEIPRTAWCCTVASDRVASRSGRNTIGVRAKTVSSLLIMVVGCASPLHVRPLEYQVKVTLDPATHRIEGRATIEMQPLAEGSNLQGPFSLEFDLHENLQVIAVTANGAKVRHCREQRVKDDESDDDKPTFVRRHTVTLDRAGNPFSVTFDYDGELYQDVAAGEKRGEIHNFEVSAHISPEGIYLSPDSNWYPTLVMPDAESIHPDERLANWVVEAGAIDDYELVATGYRENADKGGYRWVSPHPLSGVTLTGGRHDSWSTQASGVLIRVHLQACGNADECAENERIAWQYLDRVAKYIEQYEPLLGPFPYAQYTVIENFFSSGFAFPTMTLFGPVVMRMGENSFRHGYLDHELVHSWWGCGVEVDPRDGNWCEALTSYCTNYYGHLLDHDPPGARKVRRNHSNFLSRIKPEDDKPLATFGLKDGAGRGIGYSKGAAVFQMIARKIGQVAFWNACRQLTHRYMGRHVGWKELKAAFEEAGGIDLTEFFSQWVRGRGAPQLSLMSAEFDGSTRQLRVDIGQGNNHFALDVPLRLYFEDDSHEDVDVEVGRARDALTLRLNHRPTAVELDPDYQVFRKLTRSEVMPTTAMTKSSGGLTIVIPPGEPAKEYLTVADDFREAYESRRESNPQLPEVQTVVAEGTISVEDVATGGLLVLGAAARHPVLQTVLSRSDCALEWRDDGFVRDGVEYTQPNQAILCTTHHPDHLDDGVTIYVGNDEPALANAGLLGFYANSLLVFETAEKSEVILRRDFESKQIVYPDSAKGP